MSEDVKLRLARLGDAEHIALMSRDLIEVGLGWRWQRSRVAEQIRCADTAVLVACDAVNRVVGVAIMHFLEEDAHLLLLAVIPPYRRRGLGRRLLEWLEKSARVAGIATIQLEVRTGNRSARAFYRALGYQDVALLQGYYYGLESAVRMVHELRVAL